MHRLNYKCAFSRCFQFKGFCLLLGLNIPLLLPLAPFPRDEPNYEPGYLGGGGVSSKITERGFYNLSIIANHEASLPFQNSLQEGYLIGDNPWSKRGVIRLFSSEQTVGQIQCNFCKSLIVNFTAINNETKKELTKYFYKKRNFSAYSWNYFFSPNSEHRLN